MISNTLVRLQQTLMYTTTTSQEKIHTKYNKTMKRLFNEIEKHIVNDSKLNVVNKSVPELSV